MKYPRQKPLSLGQQKRALERDCTTLEMTLSGSKKLVWVGEVRPSPATATYRIKIEYDTRTKNVPRPRVYAVDPKLEKRDGKECPHLYADGGLCLYFPPASEWGPHMFLANTTVPWASRWLYFYEIWLVTGEWYGGGIHLSKKGSGK